MIRFLAATILICALVGAASGQTVLRVDADRPAGGDGLTWDTAFADLQDALAAATDLGTPVDVWIAEGTYLADHLEGSPFRSFEPPAHCRLFGGFAGDEDTADVRDWELHPAILDGDLWGDDFPDFVGYANNTRHLVKARDLAGPATLDGLTLRGGFAYNSPGLLLGGGAVYALRSDVVIAHCRFEANWAGHSQPSTGNWGGAVYLKGSGTLTVTDSVFEGNRGGAAGGALAGLGRDGGLVTVRLDGCRFLHNAARQDGASGIGGAVCVGEGAELVIADCRFEGNDADYVGALKTTLVARVEIRDTVFHANTSDGRAAVHLERSDDNDAVPAVLERCDFTENHNVFGVFQGSALYLEETIGHLDGCRILDNRNLYEDENGVWHGGPAMVVEFEQGHRFVNCLVAGNHAGLAAGLFFDRAGVELVNCTVVANTAGTPGAAGVGVYLQESSATVANTVVWGNRAGTGLDGDLPGTGTESQQFAWYVVAPLLDHCLLENWTGNLGGVDNSGLDPDFTDAPAGDFRPRWPSAAIDTGSDAAVPAGVLVDLDGEARFRDGDGDGLATVDRGAYEAALDLTGVAGPGPVGMDAELWVNAATGSGRATVRFGLPRAGPLDLAVYDLRGRRVAVLAAGWHEAGEGRLVWDGADERGRRLPSGAYLLELRTGPQRATGRLLLVR